MFQLASSEDRRVKLEIEDPLDDARSPFTKKQKHSSSVPDQATVEKNLFPVGPSQYNPLDEPSPLGLRLRKSPSLLDLIQMRLSQETQEKIKTKGSAAFGATDKLKASNFPASLLRIGDWEYASRYEGDLVAKCYFAKHKLVWEILEGGLKSKIEIQWSDIMGLKAEFPDDAPTTLVVVVARRPLFFRETNPQPRKHTLWQATTDFTNGQASLHRKHFLQIPHGLLNKHFEKLIQCDTRLNFLSQQSEINLNSPYFESQSSAIDNSNEPKSHILETTFSSYEDVATPSLSLSSSVTIKQEDAIHGAAEIMSHEAPSPSSVMDKHRNESKSIEQLIMKGLRPSMSMTELVNHIGNCISEQTSTENPSFSKEGSNSRKMLEDMAQHLLGDFQISPCSDEKSLMLRVNSLCSLLQKDGTPVESLEKSHHLGGAEPDADDPESDQEKSAAKVIASEGGNRDALSCKQAPGMSRIDSYGDLLLHLPRIASLPKFLFDISEDGDNQAR